MKSLPSPDQRADACNGRLTRLHLVVTLVAAIALGGCASVRQQINGWFGEAPPPVAQEATAPPEAAADAKESTYYAAVEGLTVYEEASESSKVVGHLALHERVARSKLERGYAYVSADKRGLKGWVDNSRLTWRVTAPDKSEAAKTPGAPVGAGEAAGQDHPTAAESAPTPTSTPETQTAPPQAVPPTPPPTRKAAKPEVYEPF